MQGHKATAVVTGGASGLGAATARALSARGHAVFALDLTPAIEAAERPPGVEYLPTDVRVAEEVRSSIAVAAASAAEHRLPLRVAVNCAGTAPSMRILGRKGPHDPELFARTLAVNLIGTFHVLLYASEAMAGNTATDDGSRGVIVNTASIAAFDGQMGQVAYAASKGGIVGMTLPAARDLAQHGIRVCTIAPGIMETPMFAAFSRGMKDALAASVPFPQRLGEAAEFARLVEMIIDHGYLNGETVRMDGALRLPPR
ncbi:SDR family NAD(P)-dependent oxidoreductase [Streptomyces sp. NPDC004629]|uniref:SDR family NAD(P)-dependent oxidoreductase n=1 Tax=Streptomyces sp. NPDC004629 TaxID=3364705 RepID=UPI0036B16ABD